MTLFCSDIHKLVIEIRRGARFAFDKAAGSAYDVDIKPRGEAP